MNKFIRHLLLFLTAVLIVLLIVRTIQSSIQKKASNEQAIVEYQLYLDRQQADNLYARLLQLKSTRDLLVVPQMEISIKL